MWKPVNILAYFGWDLNIVNCLFTFYDNRIQFIFRAIPVFKLANNVIYAEFKPFNE